MFSWFLLMKIPNFLKYQENCRRERGEIFKLHLQPNESHTILDLGGGNGTYISKILPFRKNITVADIDQSMLEVSAGRGYKILLMDESGRIPCENRCFDIVFCSSVIEHVTIDKNQIDTFQSNFEFKKAALHRQKIVADEIRRVGKSYFVQTPYKYFPLESHSRLPFFIVLLPRNMQVNLIKLFRKFWFAKTTSDWNLLTLRDMRLLFPEADIVKEKLFFFTKSLMAIHKFNK